VETCSSNINYVNRFSLCCRYINDARPHFLITINREYNILTGMKLDRTRIYKRRDEARQKLSKLLHELEDLMATKERMQLRLRILRGHQPYLIKLIKEKQGQLEQIIRQMGECHENTKRILAVIEESQRELRVLVDINFDGLLGETDENDSDVI